MNSRRGITLVELLAAMVISALVITLASRFFLTHQREYLHGVLRSERLTALNRARLFMKEACQKKIHHCAHGQLALATDSGAMDLGQWVKQKFPEADSITFYCRETDGDALNLLEWQGRFQPELIEYRLLMKTRGERDWLEGSILK